MDRSERLPLQRVSRTWQAIAVLAYLGLVAMNWLATALPLAGRSTGDIADRFPVTVTPAGYAFSIWGLIYLALGAFAVLQALPGAGTVVSDRLRRLFVLSCLFNVAWLVAWHNLYISLSLLFMLFLLLVLIASYGEAVALGEGAGGRGWLLRLPFSLYLGWISVATLVNIAVILYDLGLLRARSPDLGWTILSLGVVATVTLLFVRRFGDVAYALVAVWAIVGILVANLGATLLVAATSISAALILLVTAISLLTGGRRATPSSQRDPTA